MDFVESEIGQILCDLPNECAYLDYKEIPYHMNESPEFIRDVISMLNSEEAVGKNKYIIIGINNERKRIGINCCQMQDDADYQTIFDFIKPRPHILTGTVNYEGRDYGFIYIFADNNDRVYEVAENKYGDKSAENIKKFAVCQGQAYLRRGSKKYVMMREDRDRLNSIKTQPDYSFNQSYNTVCISSDTPLLTAAIIGGWSEEYPNDIKLLEDLTGESYSVWINKLNTLRTSMSETIICNGSTWKIENREHVLAQFGKYLYDSLIDILVSQFEILAAHHDPKFDLPSEQRFAVGVLGEKRSYSKILLHRFTEFWTLANLSESWFTSCSKFKIKHATFQLLKFVFSTKNWKVLASFEGEFQLFAEAVPERYMETIQQNMKNSNNGLIKYLHESEKGVTETKYGAPLYRSLAVLSRFPQYFSDACYTLMLIAKENRAALSTITGIMLPWCPQTAAPLNVRKGLLAGLMEEDYDLGWELAISLLPGTITTGFPADGTLYLSGGDIPEDVSNKDYWEVSLAYLHDVTLKALGNVKRLLEIISFIDRVPKEGFVSIYKCLNNSAAYILDMEDRYTIWDALLTFTTKHRRFSDATWALPEVTLKKIDLLTGVYCPNDRIVQAKRLFKTGQYDLIIENDYETARTKLQEMQNNEIRYIWSKGQLAGLLDFVLKVDCAYKAGVSLQLSGIENNNDDVLKMLSLLTSDNSKLVEFCKGYVINQFSIDDEKTENILRELEDGKTKSRFLALFPFSIKIKQHLDILAPDEQDVYWHNILYYCINVDNSNDLDYIVDELVKHLRANDAIELIYRCICDQVEPSCDCVFKALYGIIDNFSQHGNYEIVQTIGWMQKHECDKERLFAIEWKYLNLLNDEYGVEPVTLFKKLSNEPQFFIEALTHAYKGHHEPKPDLEENELKIAKHFNHLLFSWHRTPGMQDDGTINECEFQSWMSEVRAVSCKIDRYEVAMHLIGKVLFHCPPDKNGLFINTVVARTLQNDVGGHILDGYRTESINARGVYSVDPTGAPEFALEQQYNNRATAVDALGMFRFAKILRKIADYYKKEALENIEEHQATFQEDE